MEAHNKHGGLDSAAGSSDDRRSFVMTKEEVELIVVGTISEVTKTIKENPTRKIEKEDIQIALQKLWPDKDGNNELATTSAERRSLQLKFLDEVSLTVLTGEKLNGQDGAAIRLGIFDKMTGQLVASGPEASIKVEILLLLANHNEDELNWSFEDFNKRIIRGRNKGKPYFSKDMYVYLSRGMGILCDVKLGHGSNWWVKDCLCRLGARVVDNFSGIMVKEAWTTKFMVRDRHREYSKKKETPSLSDKICRVRNIWKGGKIDKRLQREKIYTVEDLLIRLLRDYDGLKNIVNLRGKRWEDMLKHARACPSGRRMYCHTNSRRKTSVVFNIHGENLRLYPKRQYAAAQMSSQKNKDIAGDLFSSAIGHWEDVFEFDDESLLQQHLSSLVDQSDSTQEIDRECIIDGTIGADDLRVMHDLNPETMHSNATFENSKNAEAGTEGTEFRSRNQDNEPSVSTSSYFTNSFPSPATDNLFSDMDPVPPPLWNDNIRFSDIDKWGWNVLITVLRWRNLLRRISVKKF